jgi:hypothetical protein
VKYSVFCRDFTKNWSILTHFVSNLQCKISQKSMVVLYLYGDGQRDILLQLFILNALKKKECNIVLRRIAHSVKTGGR